MNEAYRQDFIRAGAVAKEVRAFGKSLVQKGASYNAIMAQINQKIKELGARPAFPPQMALNEVAAHFLPMPGEDIIFTDQVVKLDVGICVNGAIGDCAVTIDLSGKYQKLIEAAEAALLAAEQIIKVGLPIREIGKVIAATIGSYGFTSIKNLSGHGLGPYKIHTAPSIPNYEDKSTGLIKPGMTFAIEPFATNGRGYIYESGKPAIFAYVRPKPGLSPIAHKLLVQIKTFTGLPFSIHDLIDKGLNINEIDEGLAELLQAEVIAGYGPLIEQAQGFVAQAENSVLVDKKGHVLITTR